MNPERTQLEQKIRISIQKNLVTFVLGPRAVGKTALANTVSKSFPTVTLNMENPVDFDLLHISPKGFLEQQKGLIVIEEFQRFMNLEALLPVFIELGNKQRRFLLVGNVAPSWLNSRVDFTAGKFTYVEVSGLHLSEIQWDDSHDLWLKGGFPESFYAETGEKSYEWRQRYIRTVLERDIHLLGLNIPSQILYRFCIMFAHANGQVWKGSDFARSLGVSEPTIKRYLDILTDLYVFRQIQPWHENLSKRQVKAPKVYVYDSGILHSLLSLPEDQVLSHPKVASSWEGFVIEQIIRAMNITEYYYWRTHTGVELDLFVIKDGKRYGFEIQYSDKPMITRSIKQAIKDLRLDALYLIYQGKYHFDVESSIKLVPFNQLKEILP